MPYDAMGNYIPDLVGILGPLGGPLGQLRDDPKAREIRRRNGSGLNLPIPARPTGSDVGFIPTTRADFERIQQNPNANQQFNPYQQQLGNTAEGPYGGGLLKADFAPEQVGSGTTDGLQMPSPDYMRMLRDFQTQGGSVGENATKKLAEAQAIIDQLQAQPAAGSGGYFNTQLPQQPTGAMPAGNTQINIPNAPTGGLSTGQVAGGLALGGLLGGNLDLGDLLEATGNYLMGQSQNLFGQVGQDPAAQQAAIYEQIRATQMPEEERQRLAMQENLFASGRGGLQTAQYGGSPEQFAYEKARQEAMANASLAARQQAMAEQQQALEGATGLLGAGYQPQQQAIRLGNQAAMTKGIEILGAPPKEEKIYPPEIKQVGDEFVTISTNPDTVGAVINRTSAKSEAVVAQEKEVDRQKKAQYTQDLVIKRNALIEQAAAVRLAVKTVIDDSTSVFSLSPEQSMALQKQSPIYGAFIGGSTYANLENAIAPIKSAQALTAIADLKAKSSTGATGLGATNAMEFSALQDNIARLDAALPDTIEPTLQAIEKNLSNLLKISQGLEPDINWDDPAYAHMVSETSDGKRVYTYDGYTFYEVPANPPATE
jgi:hypothetical protein